MQEEVLSEELVRKSLPELSEEELEALGVHGSEIRNFKVHEPFLRPGETTKCTGELWHSLFHLPHWERKKGTVQLLSDDVKVDETYTETGYFTLIFRAPMTEGVYFVRARHPGITFFQSGCESDRVPVKVEKKAPPPPPPSWWERHKKEIAIAGTAGIAMGLVLSGVR